MRAVLALALALTLLPAAGQRQMPADDPVPETRLPSGKLQRDELLKERHKDSLRDVQEIQQLTADLRAEIEKQDYQVVSLTALKKAERIEKLARAIRNRMRY